VNTNKVEKYILKFLAVEHQIEANVSKYADVDVDVDVDLSIYLYRVTHLSPNQSLMVTRPA